jgi:hypothetical protein
MCTRTETTLTVGGKYQAATIRSLSMNPHTIPKWQWIGTWTDIFRTEAFGSPAILSCLTPLHQTKGSCCFFINQKKMQLLHDTCVPQVRYYVPMRTRSLMPLLRAWLAGKDGDDAPPSFSFLLPPLPGRPPRWSAHGRAPCAQRRRVPFVLVEQMLTHTAVPLRPSPPASWLVVRARGQPVSVLSVPTGRAAASSTELALPLYLAMKVVWIISVSDPNPNYAGVEKSF